MIQPGDSISSIDIDFLIGVPFTCSVSHKDYLTLKDSHNQGVSDSLGTFFEKEFYMERLIIC